MKIVSLSNGKEMVDIKVVDESEIESNCDSEILEKTVDLTEQLSSIGEINESE